MKFCKMVLQIQQSVIDKMRAQDKNNFVYSNSIQSFNSVSPLSACGHCARGKGRSPLAATRALKDARVSAPVQCSTASAGGRSPSGFCRGSAATPQAAASSTAQPTRAVLSSKFHLPGTVAPLIFNISNVFQHVPQKNNLDFVEIKSNLDD